MKIYFSSHTVQIKSFLLFVNFILANGGSGTIVDESEVLSNFPQPSSAPTIFGSGETSGETIRASNFPVPETDKSVISECNDEWSTCDACCPGQELDHYGVSTHYRLLEREMDDEDCSRTRCVEVCRTTWNEERAEDLSVPFPVECFENCGCEIGTCGYWAENYYFGDSFYFDYDDGFVADDDVEQSACGYTKNCSSSRSDPDTFYCSIPGMKKSAVYSRTVSAQQTNSGQDKNSYNYGRKELYP